jgi:hypothetical protein
MMVLMGFTFTKVLLGVLCTTLALLVFAIAYKKLLAYFGKSEPAKEDYCVLHGLDTHPSKNEIEFYFTTNRRRNVVLELLKDDLSPFMIIHEKNVGEGGHIIRFDSKTIKNGTYFYQLRTENQKTMKRFTIINN